MSLTTENLCLETKQNLRIIFVKKAVNWPKVSNFGGDGRGGGEGMQTNTVKKGGGDFN